MEVERLNINVGGKRSAGFEGDETEFERLAALVGAPLPEQYIKLIRTADGGHPELGCFCLPGPVSDNDFFEISKFYSIGSGQRERVQDILATWQSVLGDRTLPIGRDGGGNQIFLDLNDNAQSVWIVLHNQNMARVRVASNLGEFIDSLFRCPDHV